MDPGSRVIDSETSDSDPAIVVKVMETQIDEYEIDSDGTTVADVNEEYPVDDWVVVVVFESVLEEVDEAWYVATVESLQYLVGEKPVQTYAYPESRLRVETPAEDVVTVRRVEDGNRYVQRLRVTGVGERLVYGEDFDGVDHGYGMARPVCFNKSGFDVAKENLLSIEYESEKDIGEEYPPLLSGVCELTVVAETASPDHLLDL